MSNISIEVKEGKKPETQPPADQIGKTHPHPPEQSGEEVGGRAHYSRMVCWWCNGVSTILVSDYEFNYYDCCFCGTTNGPF